MEESEDNLSAEEIRHLDSPTLVRSKSKKRSLVERELETNLTARVTSPITNGESNNTSRYGRARRLKTGIDSNDSERSANKAMSSPKFEKSPIRVQSPVYKMHASNSPLRIESSLRISDNKLETQIENIYNENLSLSRFGSDERSCNSPAKKFSKVYIRKDLIQSKEKEKEETITLIKNMFSPAKLNKPSSTHLGNILERSSEKYDLGGVQQNGRLETSSVVKTLDFDGNKKKKRENKDGKVWLSKNDIFEMEAKCEYQVGDLAWARMGTYPFWPCIITRDPLSGTFIKKKLFGRIEHDVLHVTFFGDNGRRGWIVDNMLRKFMGRLEFETARENYTSEEKKRDPRLYAAFFISEKKKSQWSISVDEAEALLREPKRLRIDILREMLEKSQCLRTTPKMEKSKRVARTNSDVSLSESLYDTLFSEDDGKSNENERRSRSKTRNKSLDVSEVVTACLDNMAAKTGITKIQRQSHMDRWLQKAKSKTPEKSLLKVQTTPKIDKDSKTNNIKHLRSASKESCTKKSLSLKRRRNESQDVEIKLLSHQNEHDYSKTKSDCANHTNVTDDIKHTKVEKFNEDINIEQAESSFGYINNVEGNFIQSGEEIVTEMTVVNEELIETENNHEDDSIKDNQSIKNDGLTTKFNETESSEGESEDEVTKKIVSITKSIKDSMSTVKIVNLDGCNDILYDTNTSDSLTVSDNIDLQQDETVNDSDYDAKEESEERMDFETNDESTEDEMQSVTSKVELQQDNETEDESADEQSVNTEDSERDTYQSLEDTDFDSNSVTTLTESTSVGIPAKSVDMDQLSASSIEFNLIDKSSRQTNRNLDILQDDETIDRTAEIKYNNVTDEEMESEDTTSTICNSYINHNKNHHETDTNSELITETTSSTSNGGFHVKNRNDIELRNVKLDMESSMNSILSNAVTIEDNLSNCEMVCLPRVVKKNYDSDTQNVDSNQMDIGDNSQNEDKISIDSAERYSEVIEVIEAHVIPVDLDDNLNSEDDSKDDDQVVDNTPLVNGYDELSKVGTSPVKEIAFLDDRSNRASVTEMESVTSDNTEDMLNVQQSDCYSSSAERKSIDKDGDTLSMKSEANSEQSEGKRKTQLRLKVVEKQLKPVNTYMEDPEFLKYLELRQDTLLDENPELTQEEITNYLYKTWLYEEGSKSDIKKTDDLEQATLVKGLNQEPAPQKKVRKRKKQIIKESYDDEESSKSKSKRKIVRPYYNEDYSDLDSDFDTYDIYDARTNKSPKINDVIQDSATVNVNGEVEMLSGDEFDQVKEYFDQLTRVKPNLFKGLIRERVCEICERTGNLVKCKGCHSTFHMNCSNKETEVIENQLPTRGRKKKKRNRGRKRKSTEDPNGLEGSQSDEKSQDVNASEENLNLSLDDIESEPRIVVDAEEAEARLCATMKEMFDNEKEYMSDSSVYELDWSDTEAGKCRIVDVLPSKRRRGERGAEEAEVVDFRCKRCERDEPVCFVCKSTVSPRDGAEYRQRCQVAHCYRRYHLECLEHWPQTQFSSSEVRAGKQLGYFEPVTCPRHVCHTCVSDDPRGCKTRFSGDKLARCVRCPATYHTFTKCLPAGTQILTGSLIICPRHYEHRPGKVPCHVNTGWCFICALGGSLICCEYCPTSFHAECLNIKPPEGGYMCEDCETGRLPLYGEMVWVKLGHYRWWPGIILHPSEIPANIMAVKHSPGEFVVRFFGQYDHYWVNRGRVFPFQEGDSGKVSSQKSKIDAAFSMAMEHAQRACEILKTVEPNDEESLDIASSLLPPHYVKLKVNKPVGSLVGRKPDAEASLTQCDCGPEDEDPCGPYSQCLNRMLLTECGPSCRAGPRCNNRAFERREYPRLLPYRTSQRGWGLKTLDHIRAGQFVIEYVGELIDEEEFKRRMMRKHEIRDENYYFLTLDKERMIDAGPKGNLARFMNHCCEPNCETQKWTVLGDIRVGLFALRDIPPNSEVTFNYNLQCAGIEKKRCLCGAKLCSGYMGAKPKQNEPQPKKPRKDPNVKRTYRKRKNVELSPVGRGRPPKRRISRSKARELTDIERDLLIIKSATGGLSSDEESSTKEATRKRKPRTLYDDDECSSPSVKRHKLSPMDSAVGD